MSRGVLAIAGMAAACWSASAAELTTTLSKEKRTVVILNGALAAGDAARFNDLLKTAAAAGQPVSTLRLNSRGGSIIEGEKLASVIHGTNTSKTNSHGTKISTVVGAGATCAGACFIPFIAGNQKFVSTTATVSAPGAHEKSDHQPAGNTPAVVRLETSPVVRAVKALGLLDAIVTRMQAISEDKLVVLNLDDLRAMGVTVTGRPTQPR